MESRIQDDEDGAVNKDVKVKTNKQQKQLNKTYIAIVGDFLRCSSRLIKGKGNLVPRVFSPFQHGGGRRAEKTLSHAAAILESEKTLGTRLRCVFLVFCSHGIRKI